MTTSKGKRYMKKVLFGIALILFGIALFLFDEFGHYSFLNNDFAQLILLITPFAGIGMSIWGFCEKNK